MEHTTCHFDALVRNFGVVTKRDGIFEDLGLRGSCCDFFFSLLFLSCCNCYLQVETKGYIRGRGRIYRGGHLCIRRIHSLCSVHRLAAERRVMFEMK
jgi:hypothetical protein